MELIKQDPPKWVVDRITEKGGLNRFGEPNFRVIWGGNRYHTVGGEFKKVLEIDDGDGRKRMVVTSVIEVRQLLKYHPYRWHLERWLSPEYYGDPIKWYQDSYDYTLNIHTMGDYPSRGDYEHIFFLGICNHLTEQKEWCAKCKVGFGEFIPLEPNVYILEKQIYMLQKSKDVSSMLQRISLFDREDKKRALRNLIVGERVRSAMRSHLALQPTSWQDGGHCSIPEAKIDVPAAQGADLGFKQVN